MSLNSMTNSDILDNRNAPSSVSLFSSPSCNRSASQHQHEHTYNQHQTIDVGTPRHPSGWCTATIHYHDFARLPSLKGESHVDSRPFRAHGLEWYLRVHPGGAASANGDGMVSLYLRCKTAAERNASVQAEFSLALRRNDGQIDSTMSCPCNAFRRKRKGWPNFVARARVLDPAARLLDEHGTLTVLVKVQLFREKAADFVPRSDLKSNILRLLLEANDSERNEKFNEAGERFERSITANSSDVKFAVEGETIHAHRLILKMAAPALALLCEDVEEGESLPIVGVRYPIFQGVLRFAYGDSVPDEVWTAAVTAANGNDCADGDNYDVLSSPAMELLDAANRFGVVGLKILAETRVAASEVRVSTASDLILYADARDCPLLKERAVDCFVAHAEEVRRHPSYRKVRESASILDELVRALTDKRMLRSFSAGEDDADYESMDVNLLRRTSEGRGLDVDGSREMLVTRLVAWDGRRAASAGARAREETT